MADAAPSGAVKPLVVVGPSGVGKGTLINKLMVSLTKTPKAGRGPQARVNELRRIPASVRRAWCGRILLGTSTFLKSPKRTDYEPRATCRRSFQRSSASA